MHCSQGFHDREIAYPDKADPRIVEVDSHPQSGCKSDSVNGVEHRKPAAYTTIAEANHTNGDCRRPIAMIGMGRCLRAMARCIECRSMISLIGGRTTAINGALP
jgi:hypothetical protein